MKDILLKVGTYQEVPFTGSYRGLRLSQAILDILVVKGILETVDCINYSVVGGGGSTTVDVTYNQSTSLLTVTVNGVSDTVVVEPLTTHVETSASLTIGGTPYAAGTDLQTILVAINAALTGGTNTDLAIANRGVSTLDITSSTGADVTVPAATTSLTGLMTAADKVELAALRTLSGTSTNALNLGTFTGTTISDNLTIKAALQSLETAVESVSGTTNLSISNITTTNLDVNSSSGTDITLPSVTTSAAGLMTAADKLEAVSIRTLSGTSGGADNLGTFSGTTFSDTGTIKAVLQIAETVLESHSIILEDTAAAFRGASVDKTTTPGTAYIGVDIHNNPLESNPTSGDEVLVYDTGTASNNRVTLQNLTKGLYPMEGSTTALPGMQGLVPEPPIDSQNKFLRGDGAFGVSIPAWDNTTDWEIGDIVYNGSSIYRVTTAHNGGVFNPSNFSELSPAAGTDLSVTNITTTTLDIASSTGTDATIPVATTSFGGLMSAADKVEQAALRTLSGTSTNALNLGTFSGSTITNNTTIKTALQELEIAIETITDSTTADNGLTETGNNIQLGGTLIQTTQIDGDGFDFELSNASSLVLQSSGQAQLISGTGNVGINGATGITLQSSNIRFQPTATYPPTVNQIWRAVNIDGSGEWTDEGNGVTDLSLSNITGTTIDIESSTGTDVTLPAATTTDAGLMSATDKEEVGDLRTLTGTTLGDTDLGTFSGVTIANNVSIKTALQSLETAVEGKHTAITFQDEGSGLGSAGTVTTVNFVGTNVTATRASNTVTVAITGGTGGDDWGTQVAIVQDSLDGDGTVGDPLKLVNDDPAPGNNYFYGTGVSGIKGFFPFVVPDGDYGDVSILSGVWNIDAGVVGTTELTNSGVTFGKIQNITSQRLLGRTTALSGVLEEISVGSALSLSSLTLSLDSDLVDIAALTPSNDDFIQRKAGVWTNRSISQVQSDLGIPTSITLIGDVGGTGTTSITTTIANDAVTYAKIQNVTADRILGRISTSGDIQEIPLGAGLSFSGGNLVNTVTGVVNWTEAFSSATQATSSWTANNAASNVNAAIIPKGTGAITVAMPDGTSTGGNSRGSRAVDLQINRSVNTQVASGTNSVLVGGSNNTASGAISTVAGGDSNVAATSYTTVLGGSNNSATKPYATVAGGNAALIDIQGAIAHGGGGSWAQGHNQWQVASVTREITGITQTELFADDGSFPMRLTIPQDRYWVSDIKVIAVVKTLGNGTGALAVGDMDTHHLVNACRNIGGTVSDLGTTTNTVISTGTMAGSVVTILASNTTDALEIKYTPPTLAGTTTVIRVIATVTTTQLGI